MRMRRRKRVVSPGRLFMRAHPRSIHGGYGVMAALEVVDLSVGVRDPVAAQHSVSTQVTGPIDTILRLTLHTPM